MSRDLAAPSAPLLDFSPDVLPYWTAGHAAFRDQVRAFAARHLTAEVIDAAEREGRASKDLMRASYAAGVFSMRAPVALGGTPPAAVVAGAPFDRLYDVVLVTELMRACGCMGLVTELIGNFGMVLPLLQAFATEETTAAIIRPMVRAEIRLCFAVTEPPLPPAPAAAAAAASASEAAPVRSPSSSSSSTAASPTARLRPRGPPPLRTTATLSADGRSYLVRGAKLYISFGKGSDYILTAVQLKPYASNAESESSALPSLSLILIPSTAPGVSISDLPLTGWRATSTSRIAFRDVLVPASALLVDGSTSSQVALKLRSLMQSNVNQERFVTGIMATAAARVVWEDALRFARGRSTGRNARLIYSPAIREAIVAMAARSVAVESMGIQTALLLTQTDQDAAASKTDDASAPSSAQRKQRATTALQMVALLKMECSRVLEESCSAAGKILGAAALIQGGSGSGARIERIRRDAPVNAAAGGGEHTLMEFVAKQAKL